MNALDIGAKKVREYLYRKDYRRGNKRTVIKAYGGKCACCSIKTIEFLTIDHIKGDGQADRKGKDFYRYLIKEGFPQNGYRVLCMNCNWAMRFGTLCPHQRAIGKPYRMRNIQVVGSASYTNGNRNFDVKLITPDSEQVVQ